MEAEELGLGSLALFLDFDGTLVDIAGRPEDVIVDPALPGLLTLVREDLGGALAIVTGRAMSDIDAFLPGMRLDVCGLHGLQRRLGGRVLETCALPDISNEARRLEQRFAAWPGVIVENKRIGFAIHWRLAPDQEANVRAAIDEVLRRLGPGYRVQDGKAVREIVPMAAGKGAGIRALMDLPPYGGRRPIFIGDDRTDEDGFGAVEALDGIAVKVGGGDTLARFRIGSPAELRAELAGWLRRGFRPERLAPA